MEVMHVDNYDVDSPPPIEEGPSILGPDPLGGFGAADDQGLYEEKNDDAWYEVSLQDKWLFVVKHLIDKELRWDDDEDPGEEWKPEVQVLDAGLRESLAAFDDRSTAFPTVLHHLAASFENDKFNTLPHKTKLKIVGYLLDEHRERKAKAQALDSPEEPILTRAFANQNDEFIRFIMKNFSSHLPDLLSEQGVNGANCFHYIFKKHIPEAVDDYIRRTQPRKPARPYKPITLDLRMTLHYLVLLISSASARPQCIVAGDGDGNTPMHYAMSYRACRMPVDQYRKLVLQLIEVGDKSRDGSRQFNNAKQSPYLYFDHTKQEFFTENARLRALKQIQLKATPPTANRPGREDVSKQRDSGHESLVRKAATSRAKDDSPSYVSSAITREALVKKSNRDGQNDMKTSAGSRAHSSALDKSILASRINHQIPRTQVDAPESPVVGLARRDTAGHAENAQGDAKPPPRSSSPAVELRSANTGVPSSGRVASSNREPLAVDSLSHGRRAGLDPSSKPSRDRADGTEEDSGKKKPEELKEDHDTCIEMADAVRQQLKLHYIRNKSDMEAKELLYGRIASGRSFHMPPCSMNSASNRSGTAAIQ